MIHVFVKCINVLFSQNQTKKIVFIHFDYNHSRNTNFLFRRTLTVESHHIH
jgi:hypothetical protein